MNDYLGHISAIAMVTNMAIRIVSFTLKNLQLGAKPKKNRTFSGL